MSSKVVQLRSIAGRRSSSNLLSEGSFAGRGRRLRLYFGQHEASLVSSRTDGGTSGPKGSEVSQFRRAEV